MRLTKRVPLLVRGAATYSANQEARIDFSDIPPLPTAETYLEGIGLRFDMTWATGGAGDAYEEPVLLQAFDSIVHKSPGGHVWYDLPSNAGEALYRLGWAMNGKRPNTEPNGTATPLGGGAVTTLTLTNALAARLFLWIPYSQLGAARPSDFKVALRDLIGSQLLMRYPNLTSGGGGIWDTGADNQGISAGTLSAFAVLSGEDGYVASTPFSVTQHDLSGLEENLPMLNGKILHWLIEHQVQTTATLATTHITDANRDEVNLNFGWGPAVDRQDARQLALDWSNTHARARTEHLPHMESSGLPFVPIFFPREKNWSVLDGIRCGVDTKLRVTGTETTPRIVAFYTGLNNPQNLTQRLDRNKLPGADIDSLNIETAAGGAIGPGADAAQRLPVRIPTKTT